MNADPHELDKFNTLADQWWNPDGPLKNLHHINRLRLTWIESLCVLPQKNIVDIGCGGGLLAEAMAKRGAQVTGIDMAENLLAVARTHSLGSNLSIRYLLETAENLAEKEAAQYDAITCMEMLEHVPDPQAILHACAKLLKPGGLLFLSTLNRNLKSFLYAIVGAEYVLRLLPVGTHDHSRFIKPSELARQIRHAGMREQDITGISVNPLTLQFYLSKNTDVNYLMCCTRSP